MSIPTSSSTSTSFSPPGPPSSTTLWEYVGSNRYGTMPSGSSQSPKDSSSSLEPVRQLLLLLVLLLSEDWEAEEWSHADLLLTVAAVGVILSSHLPTSLPASRGEAAQAGLSQISRSLSIFSSTPAHLKLLFYCLTDTVIHNESNCYFILDSKNALL